MTVVIAVFVYKQVGETSDITAYSTIFSVASRGISPQTPLVNFKVYSPVSAMVFAPDIVDEVKGPQGE